MVAAQSTASTGVPPPCYNHIAYNIRNKLELVSLHSYMYVYISVHTKLSQQSSSNHTEQSEYYL